MKSMIVKNAVIVFLLVVSMTIVAGCGKDKVAGIESSVVQEESNKDAEEPNIAEEKEDIEENIENLEVEDIDTENIDVENAGIEKSDIENTDADENLDLKEFQNSQTGHIVCIDPGHQGQGMSEHEPIGPGATETKPKVSSGTTGVATGKAEYVMTLEVGLKLKEVLVSRGYTVVMTRESHDVSLSNVDRAFIATNAGAEAFVRLHGNGSDNHDVNGALTMCMTSGNPYNGGLHDSSRRLSELVLNGLCNATGAANKGITETDSMSGINWSTMPVTIVEMGFMTNPTEDSRLSDADYQYKLASGIADGIDSYFN